MSEIQVYETLSLEAQALADMSRQEAAAWLLDLARYTKGRYFESGAEGISNILTSGNTILGEEEFTIGDDKAVSIIRFGTQSNFGRYDEIFVETGVTQDTMIAVELGNIPRSHLESLVQLRKILGEEKTKRRGGGIIRRN